jgi:hypothetical protein
LRDPDQSIREGAAESLKAALQLIAKRDPSTQERMYHSVLEEANKVSFSAQANHVDR